MNDEQIIKIRKEFSDNLIKPFFKKNGFDVEIDISDGFTITIMVMENDYSI